MKVLQIVGYKNSGKTTLTNAIISYFAQKNVKVGALKHHGHGGLPLGLEHTDSEQHRSSGATIAGVIGEHIFQLSNLENWERDKILTIYEQLGIELLVVEGFKHWDTPKIVIIRDEADFSLIQRLDHIRAIWSPDLVEVPFDYPVFKSQDEIINWLSMTIMKGKG
jgi:molybdopterin-guanine dinucleotide biosynthesis adapter protein